MWLNELEFDEWDKEMARDFAVGGNGYYLVEQIKREVANGKARPMTSTTAH